MKAITLTVPWALLLFCPNPVLRKQWETRSWSTSYRGPLAIHAAKGLAGLSERDLWTLCKAPSFQQSLDAVGYMDIGRLPRGAVIGTVEIVDCLRMTTNSILNAREIERSFGDWSPGRYAWQLANPVLFPAPIPAKGALGLWNWDERSQTDGR